KIATRTGDSKWISNPLSRRRTHEHRGRMDAIVVGIGTVLADNPLLTARPPGPRTPARIVLDCHGRTPLSSKLVQTARETATIIATTESGANALQDHGCTIFSLPEAAGRVSIPGLLDELGRRRMTNVLAEGGSSVLGSFLDAREIDEVEVFIAPKLFGGTAALSPFGGQGAARIEEALTLSEYRIEELDGDLVIHGRRPCSWGL